MSSGAVCLGLILLAVYQVPHSVNVLSSVLVSDIAIFVLKRDVKLQLTN